MFVLMVIALIMLTASTGYLPIAVSAIGTKPLAVSRQPQLDIMV